MAWWWSRPMAKSHFYVWYLGSKEADGVRGSAVVLPVMRQLLRDSFRRTPNKATVQISGKGLKLIQTVPTMSRNGKMKMQMIKFQIAANCITYSMTGRAPFDDVVGVVMLVLNPEMHSPMHVHCYRCDSADTAAILQANLQILIGRPETQRAILDLEQRLFINGLLVPRPHRTTSFGGVSTQEARMPKNLFDELKHRIAHEQHVRTHRQTPPQVARHRANIAGSNMDLSSSMPPVTGSRAESVRKRYSISEAPTWQHENEPRVRLFGDTIVRSAKSLSMENLTLSNAAVSRFPDAGFPPSTQRRNFPPPRLEVADFPLGHRYEPRGTNLADSFWKSRAKRASTSHLNHL